MNLTLDSTLEELKEAILNTYKGKAFDVWSRVYAMTNQYNRKPEDLNLEFFTKYLEEELQNKCPNITVHRMVDRSKWTFALDWMGEIVFGLKFKRKKAEFTSPTGYKYNDFVLNDIELINALPNETLYDIANKLVFAAEQKMDNAKVEAMDVQGKLREHGFNNAEELTRFYRWFTDLPYEVRSILD